MAEDSSKIPVTTETAAPSESRPREAFARKSIAYSTTLALARGAHRSVARFSIWTRFEEPKLHLVVYRQSTSPKQRGAIR